MTAIAAAVVAAAGLLGVWVFACWRWPWVPCDRCDGTGKRRSWWGGSFRICRPCGGTARRPRPGRRLLEWLRLLSADSR